MTTRETELLAANAALELEVVRLRRALELASGFIRRTNYEYGVDSDESEIEQCVQSALSTPFTPTALNELIEKVEKRTIERCAVGVNKSWFKEPCYIYTITADIRALPTGQIKLEELL